MSTTTTGSTVRELAGRGLAAGRCSRRLEVPSRRRLGRRPVRSRERRRRLSAAARRSPDDPDCAARRSVRPLPSAAGRSPRGRDIAAKRWPHRHWNALIERFLEDGWRIVVVGGPDDPPAAPGLPRHERLQDWTGRLTVAQTTALLERADLFIGADSGPAHLAASAGTLSVILFSGTNQPRQWRPWSRYSLILRQPRSLPALPPEDLPAGRSPVHDRASTPTASIARPGAGGPAFITPSRRITRSDVHGDSEGDANDGPTTAALTPSIVPRPPRLADARVGSLVVLGLHPRCAGPPVSAPAVVGPSLTSFPRQCNQRAIPASLSTGDNKDVGKTHLMANLGIGSCLAASAVGERDAPADLDLVCRAQNGDVDAFGALFERHYPRILDYLYHQTLRVATAEDLTSNAFYAALRGLERFRGEAPFCLWLYRIATNELRMWRRTRRRHPEPERLDAVNEEELGRLRFVRGGEEGPAEDEEKARQFARVRRAMLQLGERYQEVLVLRYFEGLDNAHVAQVLGKRGDGEVTGAPGARQLKTILGPGDATGA